MAEYLLLKWGTLKDWSKLNKDGPAYAALKRYFDEPTCVSAAMTDDTPTQKQAICDCIDALDGTIQNDWSGEFYTKEQAKKYVMEYGKD